MYHAPDTHVYAFLAMFSTPFSYRPNRFDPSRFVPRHHLVYCTCSCARCNDHDVNCTVGNLLIRYRHLIINGLAGVTYWKAICSSNASSRITRRFLCIMLVGFGVEQNTSDVRRMTLEGFARGVYVIYGPIILILYA